MLRFVRRGRKRDIEGLEREGKMGKEAWTDSWREGVIGGVVGGDVMSAHAQGKKTPEM